MPICEKKNCYNHIIAVLILIFCSVVLFKFKTETVKIYLKIFTMLPYLINAGILIYFIKTLVLYFKARAKLIFKLIIIFNILYSVSYLLIPIFMSELCYVLNNNTEDILQLIILTMKESTIVMLNYGCLRLINKYLFGGK